MLNTNPAAIDTIINQRMATVAQDFDVQKWKIDDRVRRFLRGIAVFLTLDFLIIVGITVGQVWVDWQTKNWSNYSSQTNSLFPMFAGVFSFFHLLSLQTTQRQYRASVGALRQAATHGDERLAPIAAVQPASLASSEYVYGTEHIGPLRGTVDARSSALTTLGATLLFFFTFFLGGIGLYLLITLPQIPANGQQQHFWQIVLVAVSGFLVVSGVISFGFAVRFIIRGKQIGKGIIVEADEIGFRWQDTRWGTGKHTLAWSNVQSIVTCQYRNRDWQQITFYALQGTNETLLWSKNFLMPDAEFASAERLCRLAITQTKKPLRQISYSVRGLALASYLAMFSKQKAAATQQHLHPGDIAALATVETVYTPQSLHSTIRSTIIFTAIFTALFLMAFLLFVPGPWLLQHLH